jgi:SAM-dependent methyltransferase
MPEKGSLARKEQKEIDFWKHSNTEGPDSESVENIVDKIGDAQIFLDCIQHYKDIFGCSASILELGAGQGWASCIIKSLYPKARVTATDISPHAVASIPKWEHVFKVQIDQYHACKSYNIPEEDASLDCVFCFAAAHHFVAHRRTLQEIARVLSPGGNCLYFYEPSCPSFWHPLAYRRVNRKRPEVPEDVLIYSKIRDLASDAGLNYDLQFYPSILKRGAFETVYYTLLRKIHPLQRLLPCTVNYHFSKPSA